jgi:hypothetical protein
VDGVLHLLTAKHVIAEQRDGRFTGRLTDGPLIAYFNNKDGTVGQRSIGELKKEFQVEWVFHSRSEVDLAILPFGINLAMDDVLAVPDAIFLRIASLTELTNVYLISRD